MSNKECKLVYSTELGKAYQGDARDLLKSQDVSLRSVDLIFTSPPFALTRPKEYGNKTADEYLTWFERFIPSFKRVLADTGSLVIDLGGTYLPNQPKRSTYQFELAVMLSKYFDLCQEFYWYNPAKLPSPAEWVNVRRLRVKDSVNLILWFAKNALSTKANNRRVLRQYSESMKSLLKNGYQVRKRPSEWDISDNFTIDHGGSITANLLGFVEQEESSQDELSGEPFEMAFDNILSIANTASRSRYLDECRKHGLKPHSARFPINLPAFFIQFLTEPGDLVCDPFAGSNTTGIAAEKSGRRWISCELDAEGPFAGTYVRTSAFWFPNARLEPGFEELPKPNWVAPARKSRPISKKTP